MNKFNVLIIYDYLHLQHISDRLNENSTSIVLMYFHQLSHQNRTKNRKNMKLNDEIFRPKKCIKQRSKNLFFFFPANIRRHTKKNNNNREIHFCKILLWLNFFLFTSPELTKSIKSRSKSRNTCILFSNFSKFSTHKVSMILSKLFYENSMWNGAIELNECKFVLCWIWSPPI